MDPNELLEEMARAAQEHNRTGSAWCWNGCTPEYKHRMRELLRAALKVMVERFGLKWPDDSTTGPEDASNAFDCVSAILAIVEGQDDE